LPSPPPQPSRSHPPPLFLRLNNEIRGPFAWDRLCELAESGVITSATESSQSGIGPWTAIREAGDYAGVLPQRAQLQFKARPFEKVNQPSEPPAGGPAAAPPGNEVENILRLNREREKQAGLDQLRLAPPVPNRRRRDYLMLLIGGNLVIVLGVGAIAGPIIAAMLAAVFTVGVTWVLYGVMDKY
jgi:hypothetical protein